MTTAPDDAAQAILRAHDERLLFGASTAHLKIASMDEAYAIQERFMAALAGRHGGPVGYKIGLTSRAMQEMCRIDTPLGGTVLAGRVFQNGASVPLGDLVHPGIEFEIAVRLGRDLTPDEAPFRREVVAEAVSGVAPAFEIVDDRQADYGGLDPLTLVADNAWNEGVVLGEFTSDWPELDTVQGIVELNGGRIAEGRGTDILGHPLNPVVWLADNLAARGLTLRRGDFVMTGNLARTRFVAPGERYRLTIDGLGSVETVFAE